MRANNGKRKARQLAVAFRSRSKDFHRYFPWYILVTGCFGNFTPRVTIPERILFSKTGGRRTIFGFAQPYLVGPPKEKHYAVNYRPIS
jgi:hypothetical protein